eukprot:6705956-Ditylum_brightwellii.AAC.1
MDMVLMLLFCNLEIRSFGSRARYSKEEFLLAVMAHIDNISAEIWELHGEHQCDNAEWVEKHQDAKYPAQILPLQHN